MSSSLYRTPSLLLARSLQRTARAQDHRLIGVRFQTQDAKPTQPSPSPSAVQQAAASDVAASQEASAKLNAAAAASSQASSGAGGQQGKKPPSPHSLVYREIWPPLIRVLAYSSAVYFLLQLAWQTLDGREQKRLEGEVRQELEERLRKELSARVVQDEGAKGQAAQRGWWGWLTGSKA